jgi:2-polyprenyl-3-methyl-5-hydroxy-6-metoxy-1,4-benzoquinol methylase
MANWVQNTTVTTLHEDEIRPAELKRGQEEAFQKDVKRLQSQLDRFVIVPCPACKKNESKFKFCKYSFSFSKCDHCNTIYMNPRPTPEIMNSYYRNSENYKYWATYIFPASEAIRREKIHIPRFSRVVELCDKFSISKGTLLEIGPGFGTFCSVAQSAGIFEQVIAIEPTPEMAQACRIKGIKVIEKKIEEVKDEVKTADVIVSFEVIEHLFDPSEFLKKSASIMKPGCIIVLSCPNGEGFDMSILNELSGSVDPEHVNLFNPKSLTALVENAGFEVLDVSTPGKLDAELVRQEIIKGMFDISSMPFLKRVLIDEWDQLGEPFQNFIATNNMSSHMWLVARKTGGKNE